MPRKDNKNFWLDKKVLITGYEGFLGSNLTRRLLNYGAKIYGLDIKVRRKKTVLSDKELDRINIIKGSVESYSLISETITKNKIEYIFHLAAEAIVGRSIANPIKTFSSNIKGTWNVTESARRAGIVKAVVIASSDKAYGSHKDLPYRENTPLAGAHPYDVSKSCADLIAYTYFHTYGLPVSVTRCGNIYGPGDFNFSRIVPDAVRCAIGDKPLIIRSDGRFTRDYVYVDDIVNGYIIIAEKMQKLKLFGEAFNFSNKNPTSVLELVKKIYKMINKKPNYKILNEAKNEIKHQYLSSGKARKILGWKPKYTLEKGLKETIKWCSKIF